MPGGAIACSSLGLIGWETSTSFICARLHDEYVHVQWENKPFRVGEHKVKSHVITDLISSRTEKKKEN